MVKPPLESVESLDYRDEGVAVLELNAAVIETDRGCTVW
jgi:hypothetical protein